MIFTMCIAFFVIHGADPFAVKEPGTGLSGDFRLDVYCGSRKLFGGPFDR